MRHIINAILLSCLIICTAAADNRPHNRLITPHFTIYYADNHEEQAQRAAQVAEAWYTKLSEQLKIRKQSKTPLFLYPDRRIFYAETGIKPRETIVGLAHTRTLSIKVDASGAFEDISRVIPHEIVHVLTFQKLRIRSINLPLWMHEGIAKYFSDDWSLANEEMLIDLASKGKLIPFSSLSNVFPSDEHGRDAAYVQSYSAVKFMADTYSRQSINDLLDEIAKGEDFHTALLYSIGITPDRFENDWRSFIIQKYGHRNWANLIQGAICGAIIIASALAYRNFLARRRRIIMNMEQEQTEDENDD